MKRVRVACPRTPVLAVAPWLALTIKGSDTLPAQSASRAAPIAGAQGAWRMRDGGVVAVYQTAAHDSGWRVVDFTTGASHQLYRRDSTSFTSSNAWSGATPLGTTYTLARDPRGRADNLSVTRVGAPSKRGTRVALHEVEATFPSGDVVLSGKLITPTTGRAHGRWLSTCTARITRRPSIACGSRTCWQHTASRCWCLTSAAQDARAARTHKCSRRSLMTWSQRSSGYAHNPTSTRRA